MSASDHSGGITFLEVLLIVFITLKLCGVVSWSWWIVLSPFLVPVVLVAMLGLFAAVIAVMHSYK